MFFTRDKEIKELKERLDELESSVRMYPTNSLPFFSERLPINQVVEQIVKHLKLDIVIKWPTTRKVELKPKLVLSTPQTTSSENVKGD